MVQILTHLGHQLLNNINTESARKMIPVELSNFFAWVLRTADEPIFDSYVEVTEKQDAKELLSLAQDVIYVSHNGRKPTPKHLVLSMAIMTRTI